MKLTLIILLVVAYSWCSEAQNEARVFCGRVLSERLAALCWGPNSVKRDAGWWLTRGAARSLGGVRGKRGLATECCDKACTVEELLSYC
uniref:Insulin-related peptide 4 n=1 Tax=Agrotis ipsilon TaxID=56364 RepID=IRP4_AGRIP|nr:RecName: Full=Insulin-related peptide 4; Short=IRP-4; Contains: RecName: Full=DAGWWLTRGAARSLGGVR-amide; Flags: Precursor [Agrotis ipsilon]